MSSSLQPHAHQACLSSLPPRVCSNSCPLSQWSYLTISSSATTSSALNISQHQGLFQWVGSLHQVTKILELQLQHQPFQWIFRVDFLQAYSPSFKFLLQKVCSPSFLQSSLMHGHSPIFLSLCELMEWYYWQVIQIVLLTEFGARTKTQETNKNPQSVEFATIRIIKIPQLERSIVQTKHIPGFYSAFSLLLGWHPSQPFFPDYSNIYCCSSSLSIPSAPTTGGIFIPLLPLLSTFLPPLRALLDWEHTPFLALHLYCPSLSSQLRRWLKSVLFAVLSPSMEPGID